ncbi:MAG: class I SAM-dependent methyltransferase [Thiobacillus sp.]|nr:class I SAM-dependent methyltransferase [Thiobacillus sp.]
MRHLPISLQSLGIQCIALVAAGLVSYLVQMTIVFGPALWQFVLLQGAIAALASVLLRQPAWWPPLHFLFFPAILLAGSVTLPAWLYLAAFLILALFYWSTFRTRVPLYLSDRKAWQAVESLLPQERAFSFIDIGSGLGGVPLHLESRFPRGRFFGTEIAPAPWLISRLRARFRRSQVRFMRRDYTTLDLADYDIVFAFLSPAVMPALWQQAQAQMKSGSVFISLSFGVPSRVPDHEVWLAPGARHTLYAWKMCDDAA